MISKGIEIPQKNNKQEKTEQMIVSNQRNKKTNFRKIQLNNRSKGTSESLEEKISNHVSKKVNSSEEKMVSRNKKR